MLDKSKKCLKTEYDMLLVMLFSSVWRRLSMQPIFTQSLLHISFYEANLEPIFWRRNSSSSVSDSRFHLHRYDVCTFITYALFVFFQISRFLSRNRCHSAMNRLTWVRRNSTRLSTEVSLNSLPSRSLISSGPSPLSLFRKFRISRQILVALSHRGVFRNGSLISRRLIGSKDDA